MENNFHHTDFEEYLREKADQYKMYPSDKVWKGIDRSLRSYRKWYWTGFILLLSGISYFAITELVSPRKQRQVAPIQSNVPVKSTVTAELLDPFVPAMEKPVTPYPYNSAALLAEYSGTPIIKPDVAHLSDSRPVRTTLNFIEVQPVRSREKYFIGLSWPVSSSQTFDKATSANGNRSFTWLQDQAVPPAPVKMNRISWQLAFSPTVNYRRLTSNSNTVFLGTGIEKDVNKVVNHRPALGFELGSHAFISLSKRLRLKGGIQFNYSKYDIEAFRSSLRQSAVIALDASLAGGPRVLTSFTDINNFAGASAESFRNQYFQFSLPVGLDFRVLGNDRVSFNIAGTIQPTYLLNKNTYLITTDFKNYTKEPSLVRRWNMNAGAEAFISYTRGDVRWQVGPQFRYQLLSSYENVYPIKEYLMEYGIKVGITKTIR